MITHHDAKQIDKYTGKIQLDLPRSFHLGLVDLLNKELAGLPPMTGAAVKENCIAAVALVMKSSNTAAIYQAEAERRQMENEVIADAEKHIQLEEGKMRHRGAVEFVEAAFYKRSLSQLVIDNTFRAFCLQVASDPAGLLLIQWATNLLEKRKELE